MMMVHGWYRRAHLTMAACVVMLTVDLAFGQAPPVLNTVFPVGGKSGTSVEVTVTGGNLQSLQTLHCSVSGIKCEKIEASRFRLTIPADTPPGLCDLWAVGDNGISAPRTFVIGSRVEQLEVEPNEVATAATPIPLDVVINGQIDKHGDVDHFRFDAKQGQRVVIECWAERIDSRMRAVLEILDVSGRRLAVNRGYYGIDPLIDFQVPDDGSYVVKVHDLISSGGAELYYRLDIDTGPRVAFSVPNVIERGKTSRVALYGWNLSHQVSGFGQIEVEIPASLAVDSWPLRIPLQPSQIVLEGASFPYYLADSHAPVVMGVTDVPVVVGQNDNHSPESAQEIPVPCEICGQLIADDECDWFAINVKHGEVLYFEALGQRIHSPVDLTIGIVACSEELVQFGDEVRNIGGSFPTDHLDPEGRWVCPEDGEYLLSILDLTGVLPEDLRRSYRLSVRRESPDLQLVVVPHRDNASGLNVQRGGREMLDLFAFRRRGMDGPIRVTAIDLPSGVECPDVWLGPAVEKASVIVSADRNAVPIFGELKLQGITAEEGTNRSHTVRGGTSIRSGTPNGWGHIVSQIPLAITGDAPLRITADAHEPLQHQLYGILQARHSPGGVVDVAVHIEQRESSHQAPVRLIGAGVPNLISNQTAVIPAGEEKGYLSFFLPTTLPLGHYSLSIRAETTVPTPDQKTETVVVHSNPVTIDVKPAAFLVEVDPFAVTQARRGETIQVGYSAERINGFIGKMHTELAVPGHITDITGLRGRGETFVGQNDKGSLQIIVNEDAPLGRQPFLRLFTVGVVEDEPIYHGSCLFSLEIVE